MNHVIPAAIEIALLLTLAGLFGTTVGLGIGRITGTASRKRRTRDHLRRRLIETHHAVVMLENTMSGTGRHSQEPDGGTRLSDRVAAARDERSHEGAERVGHS